MHRAMGRDPARHSGGQTVIQGDTNGDGSTDFSIYLDGNVALAAGDFVL